MKKSIVIVLVVFMLFPTLFAAGKSEKEPKEPQKVIRIFQFKVEIADELQTLAEEYEALTGIKVKVESVSSSNYQTLLRTKFAGNEAPDIFNNEGYNQLAEWVEHLEDLSDQPWVKDISPITVSGNTIDGKIYGLPLYLEGYGMCYNKDMFRKAGITTLPTTLSAFDEACYKLKSAGFSPIGLPFGGSYNPGRFMFNVAIAQQPDVDAFIRDACAGKADFVNNEIMQQWVDFLDVCIKHAYGDPLDLDFPGQMSTFALETVAMTLANNGAWVAFSEINPNINPGYLIIPLNDDVAFNDYLYAGPSTYWVVNKNSKVKPEAKEFLNWLVSSERGQYYLTEVFNFVPGLSSISATEEQVGPLGAAVSDAVAQGKARGWEWPKYPAGAADAIGDAIIAYTANVTDRTGLLKAIENIFVSLSVSK